MNFFNKKLNGLKAIKRFARHVKIVKGDDEGLKTAVDIIRRGGVAIYPTESGFGHGILNAFL